MTDLTVVRCDKNVFISWEWGQKWKEKSEVILIPTSDWGNVSKHLLDLLRVEISGFRDRSLLF